MIIIVGNNVTLSIPKLLQGLTYYFLLLKLAFQEGYMILEYLDIPHYSEKLTKIKFLKFPKIKMI